ncbi:hypothetical protein PRIC2_014185 [Phytophthora ramorum]
MSVSDEEDQEVPALAATQALDGSTPRSDERTDHNIYEEVAESGEDVARAQLEVRLRAEVEASIRTEEEARIRAEVEALIRAEQEEVLLRARIRAEIQAEVEEKLRAEIRAQLLEEKKAQPCTICFGNIGDQVTTLCGHTFCSGCLAKWRQRGHTLCPMCRSCLD